MAFLLVRGQSQMEILNQWQEFLAQNKMSLREALLWAIASGFLFFFALREMSTWFMKTTQIKIELKRMRKDMRLLRHDIEDIKGLLTQIESPVLFKTKATETQKKEDQNDPLFPLQH